MGIWELFTHVSELKCNLTHSYATRSMERLDSGKEEVMPRLSGIRDRL